MTELRFAWIGSHVEGLPALVALMTEGAPIRGVVTLASDQRARRSAAIDYRPVCERFHLPLHEVADINGDDGLAALRALAPDIGFVIGWSQIVRPPALRLARSGMIGAHASLLPHDRGSAPVNWALIRGARETGNSLFWLSEDLDAGDLIDQTPIPITPYDTCDTVYQRVAASTRDMLLRLLPRLVAGERPRRRQPPTDEPLLPRRRPADGRIDWARSSCEVYNFVRALTRPYPGAFSWLDGRRWIVWHVALLPRDDPTRAPPGTILGSVISPVDAACGQAVACGPGALVLLELEAEDGEVLRGRRLSEQVWAGKRFGADGSNG